MERKEISSANFKRIYLIALAAKIPILAVCTLIFTLTPVDISTKVLGGALAFILFLATSFKGSRTLNKVLKKKGMDNVEWLIILNTFIVVMMALALIPIPKASIYFLILPLVVGFIAGLVAGEWFFLRKFCSENLEVEIIKDDQ